ncbi:MAG: hypothetical protein J5860_02695 [Clostridia bacterium]|nr:hypothetical protein [Clostridia bacterium]
MKKKKKQVGKTKLIVTITCVALAVIAIVGAIIWLSREKSDGIYTWFGTKMKADYILHMEYDDGVEKYEYDVPFSFYRGVYLYYKNIISKYNYVQDTETGEIKITSETDKNNVLKEVTRDNLIEFSSLYFRAQKLGVGITDADREEYARSYAQQIQKYADAIPEGTKYSGTKEQYAEKLYEQALEDLGMTTDYAEYSYYKSLLTSRVKAAVSPSLYETINEGYFAYKQIYVTFTMGDSAAESKASEAISSALARLEAGEDFDALSKELSASNAGTTTYFDSYSQIVGSADNNSLGSTVTNMVKSLSFGEHSGIMSGEESDTLGYYMIVEREEITTEFVCGEDRAATLMYRYPYYGASSNSSTYEIYLNDLEAYEQNTAALPVDDSVYKRIAINTLY